MRLEEAQVSQPQDVSSTSANQFIQQQLLALPWATILPMVALAAVTGVALWLRLFDINWDINNHLHPDERKITMVAQCLGLSSVPAGCPAVPDPANPHFFAYGSFPMYLLALVANGLAHIFAGSHTFPTDGGTFNDYNHITLVGRALSALFDTGTVLVTGLLVRRLVSPWWGVFAATFVAFTAFEIQLSHFYAVDTVLTFFVTATLFGAIVLATPHQSTVTASESGTLPDVWQTTFVAVLTGLALGLAITSKISAAPLLLPVGLGLLIRWRRLGIAAWPDIAVAGIALATTVIASVIITMPYAFLDSANFWHDVNEQSALASGKIIYPYTIQYAGTTPYIYQLRNIFIFDMGIPMALAGFAGCGFALWHVWKKWDTVLLIPLSWVLVYFGITGDFYMKFSRYQLPIFPMLAVLAAVLLSSLAKNSAFAESIHWLRSRYGQHWLRNVALAVAGIGLLSGVGLTAAYMSIYREPITRLQASDWMYAHIPSGSSITHEVWDDGMPFQRPSGSPYQYQFIDLNLYDADTYPKAAVLSKQIASADVISLASNRLIGSINKVPDTYPMTVRYYKLLFDGSLGFTLAHAPFANYPHLGPFSLPDSTADESLSVYDHPTVWIFTRTGPHLTADQIQAKLLDGISLPAPVTSLASQKTLLLTPSAIAQNNTLPPLWQRFNPDGFATTFAIPLWWLMVEVLGLLAFPIAYFAFPGLLDRGWGLAKALGMLIVGFIVWFPASISVLPYEKLTVWLGVAVLGIIGGTIFWRKRDEFLAFYREHRTIIIATELVTLAAFLFFVGIRSLDPDLWHIYRGGEKPMELAFLNGILRSKTLPPLDPWFAGGYINYYYYGQYLIANLIQLTGIVPTTAFNLAIGMLFALTISGAISVISGITRRWWVGVVGGLFVAVVGNLDGLRQLWLQIQAGQANLPIPVFDYWASSRVIPFTINEFPYWSFLYADLHAHLLNLPIVMLGLGFAASWLHAPPFGRGWVYQWMSIGLAALTLGAITCINTWDAPTYGLIIGAALLIARWRVALVAVRAGETWGQQLRWPVIREMVVMLAGIAGGAILLYLPYHAHFQSFVNGTGPVTKPTDPGQFLLLFGFWLFIVGTAFFVEIHDRWERRVARQWQPDAGLMSDPSQRVLTLAIVAVLVTTVLVLAGVKVLLLGLIIIAVYLFFTGNNTAQQQFFYVLVAAALGVALVVEVIYVRDFLDNSDWERMNTVFKFYYQVWILLALSAAIAVGELLPQMVAFLRLSPDANVAPMVATDAAPYAVASQEQGEEEYTWSFEAVQTSLSPEQDSFVNIGLRGAWLGIFAFLIFGSSIFLIQGTQVRLQDRAVWQQVQPPAGKVPATPSIDGFGYMYAWYPGDAKAITWMNENIGGSPTIVEASADPYQWYGRVSIYTGLPAVLGWGNHESQQRSAGDVFARQPMVADIYMSGDPTHIGNLIHQFHVSYVYVGQLECLAYAAHDPTPTTPTAANVQACAAAHSQMGSLAIFQQMVATGDMTVAYQNDSVTLYKVVNP